MEIKGNDITVFNALRSVHTIKGYPSTLWVLKRHITGGKMAAFYDLLDEQRVITINWRNNTAHPLGNYKVFTWVAINQKEIDEATDKQLDPPKPIKEYQVATQILEMLMKPDEIQKHVSLEAFEGTENIDTSSLETIMKKVFEDADLDLFKTHHMLKVWKWYLVMKKFRDSLPPFVEPAISETPAIEVAPKVE